MARQSLNSIGPGVSITRRGPRWTVRFVLPENTCTRYALPREPRLISERLKDEPTRQQLEREANRIGAKLDMLIEGEGGPGKDQSLAAWLDTRACGPITVNKYRSIVSRVYKHGLRKYVVESNPILRVAGRRRLRTVVRPTYRTLSMLKRELDRRSHTEAEVKELMRWRAGVPSVPLARRRETYG